MANELQNKFRSVVEEMFNRWTALKLAVEHGMHVENNGLKVVFKDLLPVSWSTIKFGSRKISFWDIY